MIKLKAVFRVFIYIFFYHGIINFKVKGFEKSQLTTINVFGINLSESINFGWYTINEREIRFIST